MKLIELIKELKRVNFEVDILNSIFSEVENNDNDLKINIGSRVLIKWEHGGENKGRVLGLKKDGAFYVNRDGYSGTIAVGINKSGLSKHSLENLSIGVYGKLDQKIWFSQQKKIEIENRIKKMVEGNSKEFSKLFDNID
jgi:hypothetical protein